MTEQKPTLREQIADLIYRFRYSVFTDDEIANFILNLMQPTLDDAKQTTPYALTDGYYQTFVSSVEREVAKAILAERERLWKVAQEKGWGIEDLMCENNFDLQSCKIAACGKFLENKCCCLCPLFEGCKYICDVLNEGINPLTRADFDLPSEDYKNGGKKVE